MQRIGHHDPTNGRAEFDVHLRHDRDHRWTRRTRAAYSCGDSFRHAPQVTTVTDTGLNANIVYTVTFKNKAAAGQWFVPFAVCYQAQTPFKDLYGHTVTTGLLPVCTVLPRPGKPLVAPCVQSITELPLLLGNVVEKIVLPAGDPRFH